MLKKIKKEIFKNDDESMEDSAIMRPKFNENNKRNHSKKSTTPFLLKYFPPKSDSDSIIGSNRNLSITPIKSDNNMQFPTIMTPNNLHLNSLMNNFNYDKRSKSIKKGSDNPNNQKRNLIDLSDNRVRASESNPFSKCLDHLSKFRVKQENKFIKSYAKKTAKKTSNNNLQVSSAESSTKKEFKAIKSKNFGKLQKHTENELIGWAVEDEPEFDPDCAYFDQDLAY
jgi:hypothetical protein